MPRSSGVISENGPYATRSSIARMPRARARATIAFESRRPYAFASSGDGENERHIALPPKRSTSANAGSAGVATRSATVERPGTDTS